MNSESTLVKKEAADLEEARQRSTNMLRHMSDIRPTYLHFQSYMLSCYAEA